jgi:peptidoglycan/LPS O-acetylase OafA/YrhL
LCQRLPTLATTPRNTQLDGWRAIAVLSVMWVHWTPDSWRGKMPFEIGLYFFLTLSGFLITRILLRERDQNEALYSNSGWKLPVFLKFQKKRALRILAPCYAAMLFAAISGAQDLLAHPLMYFLHVSNFHMAQLPNYPDGTAHYWTLAIQQQFYLLWPLVIFFTPRRLLAPMMLFTAAIAPFSRWYFSVYFPELPHRGVLTFCQMDYFGLGGLLAYLFSLGLKPGDSRIRWVGTLSFAAYLFLYVRLNIGNPVKGWCHLQQTFFAASMVGLISGTLRGLPGILGQVLSHPFLQNVGRLSYGLYLFHTTVPLFLGHVMPFLWIKPLQEGIGLLIPITVFALVSWGLAHLCWRYIEQPMAELRTRVDSPQSTATGQTEASS